MSKKNFSKFLKLIISVILIMIVIFVGLNFREIQDYFKSNSFKPNARILEIVSRIKPTPYAKRIFYATNPRLLSTENFNQHCSNSLEQTSVLGCYKSDEIFIFDVEDSELDGIKEVTAAHELLHAVWSRMNTNDRAQLSELLRADYERLKTPAFEKTMANYAKTQPGEHENELHSILGTEWADLSPELEKHYARIFENRSEIVALNLKYKSKFDSLENEAEKLNSELKNLKIEIEAEQSDYSSKLNILNEDIADFNEKSRNGFYRSANEFQSDRQKILSRVNFLRKYQIDINSKVANFNQKNAELSKISKKIQQLYESLDSNLKNVESARSL